MPKIKPSYPAKVKAVVNEHTSEFKSAPSGELYCKLCDCIVRCEKKFMVESHRHSVKHQNGLKRTEASTTQTFIKPLAPNFAEKVTKAFLSADIPLHELRNIHLKTVFSEMGHSLPYESLCRSKVKKLAEQELLRLQSYLKNEEVFMVVDESEIDKKQFFNILVGKITAPETTFVFSCKPLSKSADSDIVTREIDDAARCLSIAWDKFCLLLSDAARYMATAGNLLKKLYPKLFH